MHKAVELSPSSHANKKRVRIDLSYLTQATSHGMQQTHVSSPRNTEKLSWI
jgi:hypothetical protein